LVSVFGDDVFFLLREYINIGLLLDNKAFDNYFIFRKGNYSRDITNGDDLSFFSSKKIERTRVSRNSAKFFVQPA